MEYTIMSVEKGVERKMYGKRRLGLPIAIPAVLIGFLFVMFVLPAFALPTASHLGVDDASGDKNTFVEVPVNIANVQDGPIISLISDIVYDKSVITVVEVQKGTLTSSWDSPTYKNFAWGTRFSLVYDGQTVHALQNGATGSVVLLKFSVIGEPGETSMMDLTNIQVADTRYNLGTAPTKDGTFTVLVDYTEVTKGDFDGDGVVDYGDFTEFASVYGVKTCADPKYNAIADFDDDCDIDFGDFVEFVGVYVL